MLHLDQLQLSRGNPALSISLHLEAGEVLLLSGPTGSGKSTLLLQIAGLLESPSGTIQRPERIGLVMQDPALQLMRERVGPEVALWLEHLGVAPPQMRSQIEAALEQVGLPIPLDTPVAHLSQGQKYRLLLAAQLVSQPRLLLLDEPWAQLDPSALDSVLATLKALKAQGTTIVIAEHHGEAFAELAPHTFSLGQTQPVALPPWPPLPLGSSVVEMEEALLRVEETPLLVLPELTLRAGQCVTLSGDNGSGKSSLLLALAGLEHRLEGKVSLLGKAVGRSRGRVGCLLQRPDRQLFAATVAEEVAFSLSRSGQTASDLPRWLACLGLEALADRSPLHLSYGQQHLLALLAQVVARPDLLLLDDPLAGLDSEAQQRLWHLLMEQCQQGMAIIIASHRPLPDTGLAWEIAHGGVHVAA
ncbi:ABC transporter ATP-binding protein [Ferrimonas balearica]|uniref:ABC transporter ATP-binding protein n=1 Tax=Ferrimonas balearica TaxID=44012 RepID=UPI001C996FEC|nr:ABC transporter ATP-binding protein [Ferrimonas balearica]MBY5921328.1 ABC transporter ATP-binding protein [Ferrimonas balearica]MBY5995987.1 ABC transporter ATP-binding protein [Ferrimonas balearica]